MRHRKWLPVTAVVVAVTFLAGCATTGSTTSPGSQTKGKGSGEGNLVLVTNWGEDTCSLVDVTSGEELARIETCAKPYDVKIGPEGRFAYATCSASSEIAVIDIQAMLVAERIPVGQSPRDIALTGDGRAITANAGSGTISVVDLTQGAEIYDLEVGSMPYGVDLWEDGVAAVTLWGGDRVAVTKLGADQGRVLETYEVGNLPYTVVVSEATGIALISSFGSHEVYPLDLDRMEMGTPIEVGRSPWGIGLSPDGRTALVANFYSGDASLLDIPADGLDDGGVQETGRITLGARMPGGSTFSAAKNAAVTRTSNGDVAVITDLANNRLMIVGFEDRELRRTVEVGKAPYGIAFLPR